MKLLSEKEVKELSLRFNDDDIVPRFRGFRYGNCPPTFRSQDGAFEIVQQPDGTWRGRVNGGYVTKGHQKPTQAKRDMFVRKTREDRAQGRLEPRWVD